MGVRGYPNHHKSNSAIGLQWRSRLNPGEFRTKEIIEEVFVQALIMVDSVYKKIQKVFQSHLSLQAWAGRSDSQIFFTLSIASSQLKIKFSLQKEKFMPSNCRADVHAMTISVGLKTFFNICSEWSLSGEQTAVLLGQPRSIDGQHWKPNMSVTDIGEDELKRISYILGIYESLQILLPDSRVANAWMSTPNSAPMFNGQSAIEKILAGDLGDLALVHQYLYALRIGNV